MLKKYLSLFLSFGICTILLAETVLFRSGELIAAEYSFQKPDNINLKNIEKLTDAASVAYIALSFCVTNGRAIAVTDYEIEFFGKCYPALILCKCQDYEKSFPTCVPADEIKSSDKYTLYYAVDSKLLSNPVEQLTLRCKYDKKQDGQKIQVTFKKNGLTSIEDIPSTGNMKNNL